LRLTRIAWLTGASIALAGAAAASALVISSCAQTPTNVPVRTFQQAQRMDLVCMAVNDANGYPLPADQVLPLPAGDCPPVPVNVNGEYMPSHLFAVVTQTTPGTLAVVDLTWGQVVDEDNATPGINFIPVGQLPTDVAVPDDASMTFVSSADPLKPALYAIDNRRLLGTYAGITPKAPLALTDLPACALPQAPDALAIEPLSGGGFALLVMLRASGTAPARIAVYDPAPLMRGAGVAVGSKSAGDAGPVDPPGQLTACTLLGTSAPLINSSSLPSSFAAGPTWSDGVPYVDGGVDLEGAAPPAVPIVDGGAGACVASAPASTDAGLPLSVTPPAQADPSAMVLRTDTPLLYVADGAVPVIHVIDVSDPTSPRELAPLLATSVRNPSRVIPVGPIALSPATRDYKRFLYAVDESDGSLMVYDVTDPAASPRVPMQRPHAELNPFLPPDRIAFSAPVASVAFVKHDWLLPSQVDQEHFYSGILCNPNPNAHPSENQAFLTKGAYYRADQAGIIQNTGTVANFPTRLRGIFGFVTLSNGNIVPIDVDDWDAPCRRPDPMTDGGVVVYPDTNATIANGNGMGPNLWNGRTGLLDVPEPAPSGPKDFDEYHAPVTYQANITGLAAVTEEAFFPVSAPHRLRSQFLIQNDPSTGSNMPNLTGAPQLFDENGSPVQIGGSTVPLLLPTALDPGFYDPTEVSDPTAPDPGSRTSITGGGDAGATAGVRVQFDDPTAHINQDWAVSFEGALPSSAGSPIDLQTADGYQSLILTTGVSAPEGGAPANGLSTPGFCAWGIEDWTIGTARAQAAGAAGNAAWTSDYVEIADDLLESSDPYWSEPYKDSKGRIVNDCWGGTGLDDDAKSDIASDRFTTCSNLFGSQGVDAGTSGVGTLADEFPSRDFPIVQAFDDHLVLGRFGWDPKAKAGEQPNDRSIVGPDPSNQQVLKLARCCFHHQASFKVRTGGEWVTVGQNGLGLLHHVQVGPGGACQLSCDPIDALKNARALDLSTGDGTESGCKVTSPLKGAPGRNAPQAMRNPMFALYMQPATGTAPQCPAHTLVPRDTQWRFSMRGGFSPISISLTGGSNVGVSPQSMRFVEPFGQLAVVDGSQQGLVLIDLNTLGFAHSPYF
jgi:hypothetical protein